MPSEDGQSSHQEASQDFSEEAAAPFECFRCGICCMKYQVRVNRGETKRIADYLGLSLEEFVDRYADRRWPGQDSLLRHVNGACVFLEYDETDRVNNCHIQPVKPNACREWMPDLHRPECREGLAEYWQLSVSPSRGIEGPVDKLDRLRAFLQSQKAIEGTGDSSGT
ncbi:MAG: YkgJ family cysteine cluster protein [Chloroflexi bacterium]|nr:YkgJ family cysteine cluster protein [Chloroflexota bacterium]